MPNPAPTNATLEVLDSRKSGRIPAGPASIPGVHRATMRLELASADQAEAEHQLQAGGHFRIRGLAAPRQLKAQLGVQAGVVYVDSP
ncbi:MAG: hypothetical protein U0235_32905 [Polyangiaceae bacterium]